jgi:hypothetical protein
MARMTRIRKKERSTSPVSFVDPSNFVVNQSFPPSKQWTQKSMPTMAEIKLQREKQESLGHNYLHDISFDKNTQSNNLETSIQQAKGQGETLTQKIKEPMERLLGADFSGVRIHHDSHSNLLNRSLQARAFTTGQDVFFRQGEYNPSSKNGQKLLAHELTHVRQQSGGSKINPTIQRKFNPKKAKIDQKIAKYRQIQGKAFVKGQGDTDYVDPNDVKQGSLGDCYLLAAMMAIAKTNPGAIQKLVKEKDKGIYEVSLYVSQQVKTIYRRIRLLGRTIKIPVGRKVVKVPKVITVTDTFPVGNNGKAAFAKTADLTPESEPELWVMLIEKAYAIYMGGYDKIEGGDPGKAMEMLTGNSGRTFKCDSYSDKQMTNIIKYAIKHQLPITAASRTLSYEKNGKTLPTALGIEAEKYGIVANHAYIVNNISGTNVDLRNPWGSHHVSGLSISNFKKFFYNIQINW